MKGIFRKLIALALVATIAYFGWRWNHSPSSHIPANDLPTASPDSLPDTSGIPSGNSNIGVSVSPLKSSELQSAAPPRTIDSSRPVAQGIRQSLAIDESDLEAANTSDKVVPFLKKVTIGDFPTALKGATSLARLEMPLKGCLEGEVTSSGHRLHIKIFADVYENNSPMRGTVVTELITDGVSSGLLKWRDILGNFSSLSPQSRSMLLEVSKNPTTYIQFYYFQQPNVIGGNLYSGRESQQISFVGSTILHPGTECSSN